MGFSLFPKNEQFFDLFALSASNIRVAAEQLLNMVQDFSDVEEKAKRLRDVESEGDTLTHNIIEYLNSSFITPFDREDIHDLASKLDDVMDFIDNTANRMIAYKFDAPPPEMGAISDVLLRQAGVLKEAVDNLRQTDHILAKCIEIHSLENEGDRIFHQGITRIFGSMTDPIELIKHKDLLETVEKATDKCEDAANVLETIMIKNA